ncbi:MAG: hydroxyacylglutathione hydrolase [Pseudomonadota bacterium]|jgi:hydroxyacylglutathione hydrolase|nr:hydroxyacylglutathione hydrolase [Pseudomonadota bacterium]
MFTIHPIPAFTDNYIWALRSIQQPESVAVVDPGDAAPVRAWLEANGCTLAAVLITHHHDDHTGGVQALVEHTRIPVYGPEHSPFKGITHPLPEGARLGLLQHTLQVKAIPAHTKDHISYLVGSDQPQLFCGDTLFLAGCGRLFEGTARQMLTAMHYFASLPDNTEVYCAHEYSLANLAFAASVEPGNSEITRVHEQCHKLRREGQPTLPSTIAQEKRINPFMRTTQPSVIEAAEYYSARPLRTEVEVLAVLREWKNRF